MSSAHQSPIRKTQARLWLLALALLAGCTPPQGDQQIGVQIVSTELSWPQEELLLQVGRASWGLAPGGGSGVVTIEAARSERVRILTAAECAVLVQFDAEAGHRYRITFSSATEAETIDVTDDVFELGPALPPRESDPCLP